MSPPISSAVRWCIALAFFSLITQTASAQDDLPPEPVVTPPRVATSVEAAFPPGVEPRAETVELVVTIAEDGSVTDAVVASPVGDGFDESARAALLQFRFEPAQRDGVAVVSRIRFRYVFELPDVPEPEPVAPTTGRLVARVLGEAEAPIVDGEVTVRSATETVFSGRTDAHGTFTLEAVPAGRYTIDITAPDGATLHIEEEVVAGEEAAFVYRLTAVEESDEEPAIGVRAVIDPPPREVTRRTIPREALGRIAGTRGDALRTIELMPGVARPPFGLGMLVIRGSAPTDSEVLLDGVPVPLLYHFGGLTSFIHSRLLEQIDFYPGNFSSRYGRRAGGIVEVETRDPATDRFHFMMESGAIDTSALVEGPISDRVSIAMAVRRSTIDLIFALMPDDVASFTRAPVYYDYQLFLTWRPTDRDRVKFRFYGSSDALRVRLGDEDADTPDARGSVGGAIRFNHVHVSWDRRIGQNIDQRLTLQVGPTRIDTFYGQTTRLDARLMQIYGRAEWTIPLGDHVRLIAGADVLALPYEVTYRGQQATASEGDPGNGVTGVRVSVQDSAFIARPGIYLDLGLSLGDLYLNIGQRLDYYSEINAWSYDPRLSSRYTVNDTLRLKAGVGLYTQPPEYVESLTTIGNPNLSPIRSLHLSGGFDLTLGEGIEVGVEGFWKRLWDRVSPTENGETPFFVSEGIGRVYGGELSARIDPIEDRRYFGYVSYTLMRSERRDPNDPRWRLFDYDQTHIFTASAGYRFPRNWEIGATFRLASGNPYTPITGSVHDLDSPSYVPVTAQLNSARSPLFHRLDLRIEKKWLWRSFTYAFFIDIQNAYNRLNQEGLAFSFDYRQSTPLRGLPILPFIGVRGEL